VGIVPLFIAMTQGQGRKERASMVRRACITAAIVMVFSVFAGQVFLDFFHIRIASFQVVGGVLILVMAFSMLNASPGRTKHTPEEDEEAIEKEDVSIVPLGIPLLAGPGAISAIIVYSQQNPTPMGQGMVVLVCLLTVLSAFIILRLSDVIAMALGRTGVNVITRVMGLILAAVGVEFLATGLGQLFPGFL
jgi:multiple antibiotic resistance protein